MIEARTSRSGAAIAALSLRMRRISRLPVIVRYAIATALIVAVLLLVRAFPDAAPTTSYIVFFPVIIVCAVAFDHGTSLYVTALAAVVSLLFLIDPGAEAREYGGVAIFVATGIVSAAMVEALRHAVEALSQANLDLVHAHADAAKQGRLLGTLVEQIPDPIYVKDASGRFVHLNSAAARLLGVTPEAAIGHSDREFLSAAQAEALEQVDRAVMSSATARVVEEAVSVPGEPPRTFLSTKAPWFNAAGEVAGLVGVSRDIETRKVAEAVLKHSDEQKQVLLYDINHRIKNHLQTVVGLASVAARRAQTLDEAKAALDATGRRLTVLGQVYDRLQINNGHPVVDTRSFIEELCSDLRDSLADTRPIRFDVDVAAVELESNRAVTLGLVVNELVQNAIKYAFPGDRPGAVAVRLDADGDALVLTVADDGIGIAPGAAPLGSGMGQRLIGALAQQLGGTVARATDAGTRATLRFPHEATGGVAL